MKMMRYIVQYKLPYEHIVQVGITAPDPEAAKQQAEVLFDAGEIWEDTPEVPLLYDDLIESDDGVLLFTLEQTLDDDQVWPEKDASVMELQRREAALMAARLLVDAYRKSEESGSESVDWNDVDQAYRAALKAMGRSVESDRVSSEK